jgi:predicted LPLAT superfamily acyltransferase
LDLHAQEKASDARGERHHFELALLAALSGAPLIPCFVYRDAGGFAVECGQAIRVAPEGDRDANVRTAIQAVATQLEAHGRRYPHYWYQFYPVWG